MPKINPDKAITGIMVKILYGTKFFSDPSESKTLVVSLNTGGKQQKTRPAIIHADTFNPAWNQSFFYNTNQIVDDDIRIGVEADGSYAGNSNSYGEKIISFSKMQNAAQKQFKDYEIRLEKNGVYSGSIFLDVSYFEREEIVGTGGIPNFDLRPLNGDYESSEPEPVVYQRPPEKLTLEVVKTSKLNFYSCMDDETVNDWEIMPPKFRRINEA